MRSSRPCRVALGSALAFVFQPLWALPTLYHLTDLGPNSDAVSLSPAGKIAGTNSRHGGINAAVWTHGKPHNRVNPFRASRGHGVNDAGVVVGEVDGLAFQHAAVWHSADDLLDIGHLLGKGNSVATAINRIGDCTVDAVSAQGSTSYIIPGCAGAHPLINIGSLAGRFTVTTAINAHKEVTGSSELSDGTLRAFLYSQGDMQDLRTLPGDTNSDGNAINDLGHVVGDSGTDPSHFRGFFYDGRTMTALEGFGGTQTLALGISHHDVVVGMTDDAFDQFHAFVIDEGVPGSRMVDLVTRLDASGEGWTLDAAVAIDDAGRILVRGNAPGDNAPRSALLTPAD